MSAPRVPAIDGIHHLKIAVASPDDSLQWWHDVTGARRQPELDHKTPSGDAYAYLLQIPGLGPRLELRHDPPAARAMRRLDPVTFAVRTRKDLEALEASLTRRRIAHSPVLRGLTGWVLVTRTPDELAVRFYTRETHEWDPRRSRLRFTMAQRQHNQAGIST